MLEARDAERLAECLARGGVAVFPADTVYGVCCDPENEAAVERLYELKRRPAERPAAVMFFTLDRALAELGGITSAERRAMQALLPGPVTLLLPNRDRRYLPACGPEPGTLGLRVPALSAELASLAAVELPAMQSSANLSGGPEARRLGDVSPDLLAGVDLALDGGELPGTPSTVLDLRAYDSDGRWEVIREGALGAAELVRALDDR